MVGAREIWSELAVASRELFPCRCLCCRALVEGEDRGGPHPHAVGRQPLEGADLCAGCRRQLVESRGYPLAADGIDAGFAAVPYAGAARKLVAALKFSRLLTAAEICAETMARGAPADLFAGTVVPAPASPVRSITRGFDPAEEIATRLATAVGMPCNPFALRRRDLRRQRGRDRRSRQARPPSIRAAEEVRGEVLLVDDVSTTGATVDACARALRVAGARRVRAIVFAIVPPPAHRSADPTDIRPNTVANRAART